MKIEYDKVADAMYIRLNTGKVGNTVKMQDRLIVDIDKKGRILGIEVLDVSSQVPKNKLGYMEVGIPVTASA